MEEAQRVTCTRRRWCFVDGFILETELVTQMSVWLFGCSPLVGWYHRLTLVVVKPQQYLAAELGVQNRFHVEHDTCGPGRLR